MRHGAFIGLAIAGLVLPASAATAQNTELKPATSFLSEDLRARQKDETANPGMLWVSEGEELWKKADGTDGKSCASCHGDAKVAMKGVAARYPAIDAQTGKLFNIELRIDNCRTKHQQADSFPYESEELLALTAYVTRQSLGMPRNVAIGGAAETYYETGRRLFHLRQGQINLACAQCHEANVGRHLRSDIVSSAVTAGYPVYRLEWQSLGSLQRRLRACALGVRAVQFPYGSYELLSLELFLAKRSEGMPLEAPAIRK